MGAALGRHYDAGETQREGDIRKRIQRKAEGHRALRDRDAGDRWSHEPRIVEHDRVNRYCRWQGLPVHQIWDQCEPRGLRDGIGRAKHERKQKQAPDRDRSGKAQNSQQQRLADRDDLGHPDHPDAVAPIGQRPRDWTQKHHRGQVGECDQAQPCAGVRELPGEPAHRNALQPDADQGNGVANRIDTVVADAERAHHVAEAARGRLHPHCLTKLLDPSAPARRSGNGQAGFQAAVRLSFRASGSAGASG